MTKQRAIAKVSILMLTLNEEINLERSLSAISDWIDDIVIVDSFSTDRTLEIAKQHNARIYQHVFENHAKQWSWAMRHIPFKYEWVWMYDPDHCSTPDLKREILNYFDKGVEDNINGFYIKRRNVFRGRWIRHGGYYPKHMLKIVRHKLVSFDENEFDYRAYVPGKTVSLKHDIVEENLKEESIVFWLEKHIRFACCQAEEELLRRKNPGNWKVTPKFFGTSDQRTLWLKIQWYRMPLYIRPIIYFIYRYFIKLGFLDGKQGFVFHFLQAFWYRLIVDIKIEELKSSKK